MSRCTILAFMFSLLVTSAAVSLAEEEVPREVRDAIKAHDEDAAAIRAEAQKKLDKRQAELIAKLKQIQDDLTKAGKKEVAAAVGAVLAKMTDTFPAGTYIDVDWKGTWYDGQVLEVKDGKWKISYDGYGPEWHEWVDASRIRARSKPVPDAPAVESPQDE